MTRSSDLAHVNDLLPDYALGALPGDKSRWVAAHLARCSACRQALADEEAIGRAVKSTLARAAAPNRDRLQQLRPVTPPAAYGRGLWPLSSPALAAVGLILVLLFSALALFANRGPSSWGLSVPTSRSTAVVLTDTPTQTATRDVTATAAALEAFAVPAPDRRSQVRVQIDGPAPALVPVPVAPILH